MDSFAEAKKARDDDFDDLMAACNLAKEAAKTNGCVDAVKKDASDDVNPLDKLMAQTTTSPIPTVTVERSDYPRNTDHLPTLSSIPSMVTEKQESPKSQEKERSSPKALDQMHDSSMESDPVTVVEKDDNGFVYYKCRFCGLTFNYMNTLRAHERVHDVSQPYVCGKCGEAFEFACQLEYHTKQHSNSQGYKCECGRTFFSYTEMLYHKHPEDIQADKEKEEKLYGAPQLVSPSCSVLSASDLPVPEFKEKGYEPKHPMKVYNDVRSKPYICEYCSKSYADSRQLAYHMYSHRGEKMFNPRASRYLIGREGVGYTDRASYYMFPRTSGYTTPLY